MAKVTTMSGIASISERLGNYCFRTMKATGKVYMHTVRRDMRLKTIRKWAKLLGLCFGMPVAVVVYIYALFVFMPEMQEQLQIVYITIPIATILGLAAQRLRYFSPEV